MTRVKHQVRGGRGRGGRHLHLDQRWGRQEQSAEQPQGERECQGLFISIELIDSDNWAQGVDSIDIKNLGTVFGPILVLYFQFYISGQFSGRFSGPNLCQLNWPQEPPETTSRRLLYKKRPVCWLVTTVMAQTHPFTRDRYSRYKYLSKESFKI